VGLLLCLRASDQECELLHECTWCGRQIDALQYFESFAKKYDLNNYIKLNSKVTHAAWDEAKGVYNVKVNVEGKEVEDWCHVLINGTGFLNDWKWPK
jgi:cation diffusion facilitator CzcD-associated flavoprotein CzcO